MTGITCSRHDSAEGTTETQRAQSKESILTAAEEKQILNPKHEIRNKFEGPKF